MKEDYELKLLWLGENTAGDPEEQGEMIKRELVPLMAYLVEHTSSPSEAINLLLATIGTLLANHAEDEAAFTTCLKLASSYLPIWANMFHDLTSPASTTIRH